MFAQKYAAKPISELPTDDLNKHAKGLIFRIHTITGWSIPDDTFFLNSLVSEFTKLLSESYKDLNVEEIAYAVRNYGLTVKDWGKNINLSLIDQPIAEYRRVRRCLSEMEERRAQVPQSHQLTNKPTPEEVMSMRREVIEAYYQDFLKGNRNYTFYPTDGIETLAMDKFSEEDYYTDFISAALKKVKAGMKVNFDELILKGLSGPAEGVKKQMEETDEQTMQVQFIAKKMALLSCFEHFMAAQWEHIYFNEIPF